MITKTIILDSIDRLHISFYDVYSDNGFTFWANADIEFSTIKNPQPENIISLESGKSFTFNRSQDIYVKGDIGDEIYLSPFNGVVGVGGSSTQTGDGSPEGVVEAKNSPSYYLDTVSKILYFNPIKGATTGRQIIQSTPAV